MTRWSKAFGDETQGARGADVAKIDAGWERIRARRARPRALRRAAVAAPVLVLAALLVVVARFGFGFGSGLGLGSRGETVTTLAPLAPIALASGMPLPPEWAALEPVAVALDDGSRLELAPATRLTTHRGAPDRVELALDRGRTTFDVKPGGPRSWIIDAGEVRVEVLGTRFTVARDDRHVEVSVERGKVKVTDTKGSRLLTAGQSFASDGAAAARAELPSLSSSSSLSPPPPSPSLSPSLSSLSPPSPSSPSSPSPVAVAPRVSQPAVEAPAVAAAEVAPAVDPMAEADALRQAGRPAEAAGVLRRLVEAGDRRASLAAFTLGKMHAEELREPAVAGRWFERAIALGLPVGLDEEAQARAVECFAKAGAKDDAARAAARYEARFPGGRHLARVREWNAASSR